MSKPMLPKRPPTQEEWRASLAEQLRRIEAGEEELIPHEQVMREVREILGAARARKKLKRKQRTP